MRAYLAVFLMFPALSFAEGKEAPGYYVEGLFHVSTAEQLAAFCPSVAFDLQKANAVATDILARLAADGISGDAVLEMSGVEEGVSGLQSDYVLRHGLAGAGQGRVCEVARAEITDATDIGRILVEAQ